MLGILWLDGRREVRFEKDEGKRKKISDRSATNAQSQKKAHTTWASQKRLNSVLRFFFFSSFLPSHSPPSTLLTPGVWITARTGQGGNTVPTLDEIIGHSRFPDLDVLTLPKCDSMQFRDIQRRLQQPAFLAQRPCVIRMLHEEHGRPGYITFRRYISRHGRLQLTIWLGSIPQVFSFQSIASRFTASSTDDHTLLPLGQ
ncbi:hypothetical protein Hypma_011149 [Hypsizygus marmoreus]|uniref:Uncharacterized protein n=1 Tax=Hypsizygus marmoreus TaxID=39966 RepID=A0A369JTJ8_HYPMA|nr:hypothetical protein Hypma_011149 [Hypsizygus marmoreus]